MLESIDCTRIVCLTRLENFLNVIAAGRKQVQPFMAYFLFSVLVILLFTILKFSVHFILNTDFKILFLTVTDCIRRYSSQLFKLIGWPSLDLSFKKY